MCSKYKLDQAVGRVAATNRVPAKRRSTACACIIVEMIFGACKNKWQKRADRPRERVYIYRIYVCIYIYCFFFGLTSKGAGSKLQPNGMRP